MQPSLDISSYTVQTQREGAVEQRWRSSVLSGTAPGCTWDVRKCTDGGGLAAAMARTIHCHIKPGGGWGASEDMEEHVQAPHTQANFWTASQAPTHRKWPPSPPPPPHMCARAGAGTYNHAAAHAPRRPHTHRSGPTRSSRWRSHAVTVSSCSREAPCSNGTGDPPPQSYNFTYSLFSSATRM